VIVYVFDTTHMLTSGDGLIIDLLYLCHEKKHDVYLNPVYTCHTYINRNLFLKKRERGQI